MESQFADPQVRGVAMIGARATFCAGHRLPQHDSIHGHSYEVWAFRDDGGCVEELQRRLQVACSELDHRMLNEIMEPPTMESIARHIAVRISARLVRVVRPVEGLCCELSLTE
jgi:6-pyruvoyltetrahydropterin/6-carboxytetrahydropterin synthase